MESPPSARRDGREAACLDEIENFAPTRSLAGNRRIPTSNHFYDTSKWKSRNSDTPIECDLDSARIATRLLPGRYPLLARLIALSSLSLIMGCGPFLLLPGGKLDGVSTPDPGDWSFSDRVSTVQLETRPEDPYSVNIWASGLGPVLYVHAGANRTTWVEHMEANSDVRIRVEDKLYDLRASRVDGQEEFAQFSDAYEVKYGSRPRNENVAEAYLFRLEPR